MQKEGDDPQRPTNDEWTKALLESKVLEWVTSNISQFKFDAHINKLEGEMVVIGLHQRLCSGIREERLPWLLDSVVAVGMLAKGRSSSRELARVCEKVAGLCAMGEIRLILGWVQTGIMPADGPSRTYE